MAKLSYLENILKTKKFCELPAWSDFFADYETRLQQKNQKAFAAFCDLLGVTLSSKDSFFSLLHIKLNQIEKQIAEAWNISDLTKSPGIESIHEYARKYLPECQGPFLTSSGADKIIAALPDHHAKKTNDPKYLLATLRYRESKETNFVYLKTLSILRKNDFEKRPALFYCIDHHSDLQTAKNIFQKKCFNSHDKLLGAHLVSTMPEDFDTSDKSPILRTLTKMIHYQKEMQIFGNIFDLALSAPAEKSGKCISHILELHAYDAEAPLFNCHDVLEGLANRAINTHIFKLAADFPALKPWAEIHDVADLFDDDFHSLSLWRIVAWQLYGTTEQTIKMYRDDILADMLCVRFGEENVERAVCEALVAGKHDVLDVLQSQN